jgi:NAD(P)-dependent dehydrogenase (short-subunit alcohol dehydrogenase family)
MRLEGKAVLITGASSGIGYCAAEAFAAAGADVALSARSVDGLERAASRVRAHGRRAVVVPADLTDRAAVEAAVERAVAELGRLDLLVPAAAIVVFGSFGEVEADDFKRVVQTSLIGVVDLVRAALPALERSGGSIVAMGSLMSRQPLPQLASYAAAKHGLRGFLNTLRVELQARGSAVTVSQLHPGAVNTPVWTAMPSAIGRLPRRPPEGYDPAAVAKALVHLAEHPRAEMVFGAETRALDLLWNHARPLGDLLLVLVHHYFRSGRRPATDGLRALHEGIGDGGGRDGFHVSRPSFTNALVRAARGLR